MVPDVKDYNLKIQYTRQGTLAAEYCNPQTGFLEHFGFKEIFIRCSKKAYIIYVPPKLLESIGAKTAITVRNQIQKHFQRRHLPQRFSDVQEANSTYLLKCLEGNRNRRLSGKSWWLSL
jgi:hypothetical protein